MMARCQGDATTGGREARVDDTGLLPRSSPPTPYLSPPRGARPILSRLRDEQQLGDSRAGRLRDRDVPPWRRAASGDAR